MNFFGIAVTLELLGEISERARKAWKRFNFNQEDTRKVLLTEEGMVIVADELPRMNKAMIFIDMKNFILWLEES